MRCSTDGCDQEAELLLEWSPASREIAEQLPLELCGDCTDGMVALSRLDEVTVSIERIEKA